MLKRELSLCLVRYCARWHYRDVEEQAQFFESNEGEEEDQQI